MSSSTTRTLHIFFGLLTLSLGSWAQSADPDLTAGVNRAVAYQINPTHTGAALVPGLRPPLTIKWSVDLGASASYPLIAEGKVFVLTGCDSNYQVHLYALDLQTGTAVWGPILIPEGAYCWAAAAYDKGTIFVVPDSAADFQSGAMFAFSAKDGHQIWSIGLPGQYLFTSPPTAVNGVVYTGGAGFGGTVYAVRESDGTILWTNSVENGDNSSPAVDSTGVYVSYACPQTYRFDGQTGHPIWHYSGPCEGGGGNTAVLYNGSLYVRDSSINSYNGAILDTTSGTVTGYYSSDTPPAFLGKAAYYIASNTLKAVDIATGSTRWSVFDVPDSYSSAPIIINDVVYVGTSSGQVLGFSALTGKQVFSVNVGAPISALDYEYVGAPLAGLGAGEGFLIVPASTKLVALAP